MGQLTLISLAPLIGTIILAPLAMLLLGKQLSIEGTNLTFGRLLLIVFVGALLAQFLGSAIHPYAPIAIFVIVVAYMTKTQVKTDWGKAVILTVVALVVQLLVNYAVVKLLLA